MSVASAHPWLNPKHHLSEKILSYVRVWLRAQDWSYTAMDMSVLREKRDARSRDQTPLDKQQSVMLIVLPSEETALITAKNSCWIS